MYPNSDEQNKFHILSIALYFVPIVMMIYSGSEITSFRGSFIAWVEGKGTICIYRTENKTTGDIFDT